MAHLVGASRKRPREEDAINRVVTSRKWWDLVLRLHERYLQVAFLQQFVYVNAQQMIQANALGGHDGAHDDQAAVGSADRGHLLVLGMS